MATTYYRQTYVPTPIPPKVRPQAQLEKELEHLAVDLGLPAYPAPPTLPNQEKLFKLVDGMVYEQVGDDQWFECGRADDAALVSKGMVAVTPAQEAAVKSTLQQFYRGEITAGQIASPV